ncbi:Phage XkdN-like tail assembly chaperone protein, TAC [Natronincola peptidivorans]|uniref:Phage XkdN-like tail assembly chaperone protein, TAC n=1 Tax=Natronincola peptidivorans TaxID=426128 RepID=A0A1I0FDN8_9FIRM|nr:hypothetical protein [Natronincola peptidivorans]SET55465.1 Phage XkdN-like tail assembly chaperone protein, TAC [Natronincola peptidivorans]
MSKKLTIKELLAQKEQLKNKKAKVVDLYIESLDAEIAVVTPSTSIILEAQAEGERDAVRADTYLIFNSVKEPNLKDVELQKAYGCVEPLDIVEKIFLPGEISSIASEIMKLAGYGSVVSRAGKEVKN